MTNLQFYHLLTTPLSQALPKLVAKAYATGLKILVVTESQAQTEQINQLLWTYDPASFLPHGSMKDGDPTKHPILITSDFEPVNGASFALIANGQIPPDPLRFSRMADMFNGNDTNAVEKARERWKFYKEQNYSLKYLRQTEQGGWEQKAAA